eukprot:g4805.t1
METLLQNSRAAMLANEDTGPLSASMTEMLVQKLTKIPIEKVGSEEWMDQREIIEKLNLQAHVNARNRSEEFVLAFLTSYDKISSLVHELLVIEGWKNNVFPLLRGHLCKNVDSLTWYFVLYHELTIANLLEVCFFDKATFEDMEDDYLLELVMWCHRKLLYFHTVSDKPSDNSENLKNLIEATTEEEMTMKVQQIEFSTSSCGMTILRYITENLSSLPLCVARCLLRSADMVMVLLPLIESSPWVRSSNKAKIEKFQDNKWVEFPTEDRFRLCQLEAQAWLALCNLLTEPKSWSIYDPDDYRRDKIIGVRKYFNEILVDQIPVLRDLERVIDVLTLGQNPHQCHNSTGALLLEQIPELRNQLLDSKDWYQIAREQKQNAFGKQSNEASTKRMKNVLEMLDLMCSLEPECEKTDPTQSSQAPKKPEKIWIEARKLRSDTKIWHRVLDFTMELDSCTPSEVITTHSKTGTQYGRRYKLRSFKERLQTPLPSRGKLIVTFRNTTSEARLKLPTPVVKSEQVSRVVWVTVGSLSTDRFALQLKLKRMEDHELAEKNKEEGYWEVYTVVDGALTEAIPPPNNSLKF